MRQGVLLEKSIESLFSGAGFDTVRNVTRKDYEIDVLADYDSLEVVVECKQREKSNINIRNLIHQWKGKNEELGVDYVVIVLYGVNINNEHYKLAEEKGVVLWSTEDVHEMLDLAMEDKEQVKDKIFNSFGDVGESKDSYFKEESFEFDFAVEDKDLSLSSDDKPCLEWESIYETFNEWAPRFPRDFGKYNHSKFKICGFYEGIEWDKEVNILHKDYHEITWRHIEKSIREAKRKKDINTLLILQSSYAGSNNMERLSSKYIELAEAYDIQYLIGKKPPKKGFIFRKPIDIGRDKTDVNTYTYEEFLKSYNDRGSLKYNNKRIG